MQLPTRKSPYDREIFRLALPALGALASEPLYVLADTAVVGHLGTAPLGGLAVASSVLLIGFSLFIFLAYGTTSSVARLLGAGQQQRAAHQAVQGLWLAAIVGVVLVVLGLVAGEPLLRLLGAEGEVLEQAEIYLRISLFGVPPMLVMLAGTGYLRGLQDTRTPLIVAAASATGNLAVELILVYGLGYGIGGSALGTVITQWAAGAVYVWRVGADVRTHDVALTPDGRSIRSLLVVGRELFMRTAALRAALVLTTAAAARLGEVPLAAHQIAFEIWNLLALCLDAVAIAAQAMVGRYLGAGDLHQARAASRRMIEWGVVGGVLFGGVILVSRSLVPEIFTEDTAVVAVAAHLLVAVAVLQPVNGVVFVLDGVLIGAGDMRYLAVAMVISLAVFVPAVVAVLVLELAIGWLWAAIGLFMIARCVTLLARFRGARWAVTGAER